MAKSIHAEKIIIKMMAFSVVVNIALNCFFIPIWSSIGAAWATLISETFLAFLVIKVTIKELNRIVLNKPINSVKIHSTTDPFDNDQKKY
jgi:Na+-driven multidrug efflux pump